MASNPDPPWPPSPLLYESLVRRALEEDMGRAGDITTDAIAPQGAVAFASLVARAEGRLAGLDVALVAFRLLDPCLSADLTCRDGMDLVPGQHIARLHGSARALLTAERTALNFLGHLSGVATATRGIVLAVQPYPVQVVCTRKTTPGLRLLEKYAVRAGGGRNHRFGLDDAVLIKDNHRTLAGGLREAIRRVRLQSGHLVKIEAEVDTLEQLDEALEERVDAVLLDNMTVEVLAEGVRRARGRALTEASGNITAAIAPTIAATGVDLISVGWITHSAPVLDVALDFLP